MKHLCLLLCFLRTSVSEKSSLTFIDLISGIVSNAQYLEENLIRSKTFFNRTWPWVDLHRLTDINGSNCTQDLRIFAQDLAIDQTWAWKSNWYSLHSFYRSLHWESCYACSSGCLGKITEWSDAWKSLLAWIDRWVSTSSTRIEQYGCWTTISHTNVYHQRWVEKSTCLWNVCAPELPCRGHCSAH